MIKYISIITILLFSFAFIDFITGEEILKTGIIVDKSCINGVVNPSVGVSSKGDSLVGLNMQFDQYLIFLKTDNDIKQLEVKKNVYFKHKVGDEVEYKVLVGRWSKLKIIRGLRG